MAKASTLGGKKLPVKALVYGPPFTGKSEFVAHIAKTKTIPRKILWLDLERGFATILNSPRIDKASLENIEVISTVDNLQTPVAFLTTRQLLRGVPMPVCQEHGAVRCKNCTAAKAPFDDINFGELGPDDVLVIDSGTQLSVSCRNFINRDNLINQEAMETVSDMRDFGRVGLEMENILSYLQSCRFNVIMIAHSQSKVMEEDSKKIQMGKALVEAGERTLMPTIGTVNFSQRVGKFFSDMIYAEIINRKFTFSINPLVGNAIVGSRSGREKIESIHDLFN